jgi:hypothetical protein
MVSSFVQTTVVPGLMVMISGSKALSRMITFFTTPFGAKVEDSTAGWEEVITGFDEGDDGTVQPARIAVQTRRISRRKEHVRIKNRVEAGVVIPFLSGTGYRPVPGNSF